MTPKMMALQHRGALTVGCSVVQIGSVEIGSWLRNALMKLRKIELS